MSILDEIKAETEAVELLKDWLGDDLRHVTTEVASHRSLSCLQGNDGLECPHHKAPRWWETAKHAVACVIKKQLHLKSRFKLVTPFDDDMKMCRICGCCMGLKIWTPTEHIRNHTTGEKVAQFPGYCWVKKELS